jgi:hypothetical protein
MNASEHIDELIAGFPDWRGNLLANLRRIVRAADSGGVDLNRAKAKPAR